MPMVWMFYTPRSHCILVLFIRSFHQFLIFLGGNQLFTSSHKFLIFPLNNHISPFLPYIIYSFLLPFEIIISFPFSVPINRNWLKSLYILTILSNNLTIVISISPFNKFKIPVVSIFEISFRIIDFFMEFIVEAICFIISILIISYSCSTIFSEIVWLTINIHSTIRNQFHYNSLS